MQIPKTGHDFSDKVALKLKISKNVFNKKCGPKLLFSTKSFLSKILMILDKTSFKRISTYKRESDIFR